MHFRPGDQFKLASGRVIVLHSRLGEDSWKAKYLEDAQKQNDEFVVVREDELRRIHE
jgi:hypothetical protein